MDYLPIFLEVAGKRVIVDGGTTVAARRVERALNAGALVEVFDPDPGDEVRAFLGHERLTHHARVPDEADFQGCLVAYGASEEHDRDALLHRAAKAAGASPVFAPEKKLTADVEALLGKVNDNTRLLFLANPNNPTGTCLPAVGGAWSAVALIQVALIQRTG